MSKQTAPRCHKPGGFSLDWGTGGCQAQSIRAGIGRRLGLAIGALLVVWAWLSAWPASADGPIQVGLYVQFEDGSTFSQCVELDGPEAYGLDVLRQSEIDFVFEAGGSVGTAICRIAETGCDYPGEDCFCQCLGSPCQYWTYWYAEKAEHEWRYSSLGAANRLVKDGDVEGWVWGSGQGSPPAEVLADDICPGPVTATPVVVEKREGGSTPPPTHAATAPAPTRAVSQDEADTGSASPAPQTPLPFETDVPTLVSSASPADLTDGGSFAFIWLVAGLSGLGGVLLGLAYFVTHRKS